MMHIGRTRRAATVEHMRSFAAENGYRDRVGLGGKHHEIYLGDPRKADPAKLKIHPASSGGKDIGTAFYSLRGIMPQK